MKPLIVFCVDCSGSMEGALPTVRNKLHKIVDDVSRAGCDNSLFVQPFYMDSWKDIGPLTQSRARSLRAIGGTPLNNAIVHGLNSIYLQSEDPTNQKLLYIVITDGQNTHDLHSEIEVEQLVKQKEDIFGADVLFVGTNQNAYETGKRLGIKPGKTIQFVADGKGFEEVLDTLSEICLKWLSNQVSGDTFFSKEEQVRHSRGTITL